MPTLAFLIHSFLQRVQNATAMVVSKTRKYDFITVTLCMKNLHWLCVRDTISFKILVFVYKCMNDVARAYLSALLEAVSYTRSLRSGDQNLLKVPRCYPSSLPRIRKITSKLPPTELSTNTHAGLNPKAQQGEGPAGIPNPLPGTGEREGLCQFIY